MNTMATATSATPSEPMNSAATASAMKPFQRSTP